MPFKRNVSKGSNRRSTNPGNNRNPRVDSLNQYSSFWIPFGRISFAPASKSCFQQHRSQAVFNVRLYDFCSFSIATKFATCTMSLKCLVSRVPPVQTVERNCTRDGGGPSEFGNQVLISSYRKPLRSKAVVVNVAEKSGLDPGRYGRERRAQANRCGSVESD